jgi:DNA-binding NarL/FixJ family response regulator
MEATMTKRRDRDSPGDLIVLDPRAHGPSGGDPASATFSVLVAEGEGLVRAGFRALLEGAPDIAVAGEAANGEEAIALASQTRPDVVLMDISLPRLGGVEATRRILADPQISHVKVVILSAGARDEDLFGALRAGASGFLVRDAEPVDLVRALRVVAGGEAQLSPSVTRRLIEEFASQPDPQRRAPEQLEELTAREREVMTLVAMGLTNGEIAERLVVSPATAKTHVSRTMGKLHARDRAKLVAVAYQTGFVQPRSQGVDAGRSGPSSARALAAA